MTQLQRLRFSIAMWLAGWRQRGGWLRWSGVWCKDIHAFIPEPSELCKVVGHVNDRSWMGASPGTLRLLTIEGERESPGWAMTFHVGLAPKVSDELLRLTAADVYGSTDFETWLGA